MYQSILTTISAFLAALSLAVQIYTIEPNQPPVVAPPPVLLRVA